VFVDFALDDPGRGDDLVVVGVDVADDLDLEGVVPVLAADLVDATTTRLGLGGDDQYVELRFGGDTGGFGEFSDLVLAVELRGELREFRVEVAAALLERPDVAVLVAGLRCEFVARQPDGDVTEFERALEQRTVPIVYGVERPAQRDLHISGHGPLRV
jgi:hypothetical protein